MLLTGGIYAAYRWYLCCLSVASMLPIGGIYGAYRWYLWPPPVVSTIATHPQYGIGRGVVPPPPCLEMHYIRVEVRLIRLCLGGLGVILRDTVFKHGLIQDRR